MWHNFLKILMTIYILYIGNHQRKKYFVNPPLSANREKTLSNSIVTLFEYFNLQKPK